MSAHKKQNVSPNNHTGGIHIQGSSLGNGLGITERITNGWVGERWKLYWGVSAKGTIKCSLNHSKSRHEQREIHPHHGLDQFKLSPSLLFVSFDG